MIIAEPGSCHDGERKKAFELIDIAQDAGADAIKFQLITPVQEVGGNVRLDWRWMPELIKYGKRFDIEVFASVFDMDGARWLIECGCRSIKFAHSQQKLIQDLINKTMILHSPNFDNIYMSTDYMGYRNSAFTEFYCIPEYPVKYLVDFNGLFDEFGGFSSHTLGIKQDKWAIEQGAKIIEKHFKGNWDSPCPDARFAIGPDELKELCDFDSQKPSALSFLKKKEES